jgi:hypothetical protein
MTQPRLKAVLRATSRRVLLRWWHAIFSCVLLGLVCGVLFIAGHLWVGHEFADWGRPFFPWLVRPAVPKIVTLAVSVTLFCAGLCAVAAALMAADGYLPGLCGRLKSRTKRWFPILALTSLLFAWTPLILALGVTPFNVPNEFLVLDTYTKSRSGEPVASTKSLIEKGLLGGLRIPSSGNETSTALSLSIRPGIAHQFAAKQLATRYPEYFWYDQVENSIEIHRLVIGEHYQVLASAVLPSELSTLQQRYWLDQKDIAKWASQQLSIADKKFFKLNLEEFERSIALGRFFYHHSFIFGPVVARAQESESAHGSQYGKGLTDFFAMVVREVPDGLQFNAYLLLLYASYPIYFILVVLIARGVGLNARQVFFVGAISLASFSTSELETIRLGVGLAPWRHLFDVVMIGALYLYARKPTAGRLLSIFGLALWSIYWSREMGLFLGLSAAATLLGLSVLMRRASVGLAACLLGAMVIITQRFADPQAQTIMDFILAGANTPPLPKGFMEFAVAVVSIGFACWLVAGRAIRGNGASQTEVAWWCAAGGALFYFAASLVYLIYYPRLHHLAPVIPAAVLGLACGWRLMRERVGRANGVGPVVGRLGDMGVIACVVLLIGLGLLRMQEFRAEQDIFKNHVEFDWNFPSAKLVSTGNPEPLIQAVKLIGRHNPGANVDILSPMEVVLLPMARKGKSGPFTISFDSLLSDREVSALVRHLRIHSNEVLFVDSRLVNGLYELPIAKEAVLGRYHGSSVGRLRAHTMLRVVFSRVRECYELAEQGPLISAWKRKAGVCGALESEG